MSKLIDVLKNVSFQNITLHRLRTEHPIVCQFWCDCYEVSAG